MQKMRPLGVTILVILEILSSMLFLLGGVGLMLLDNFIEPQILDIPELQYLTELGIIQLIGLIVIILSLSSLVVSWGLWTGRRWGWTLSLIFAILGGLSGIISLPIGIGNLVLNIFIIWYLLEPHVKAFYGFGFKPQPKSQSELLSSSISSMVYCTRCGAKNSIDDNFCRRCGALLKKANNS
ncbi:zinc-ribbon domain-containing protein [Candidatus Bathyarchaeota archaeon]|nr:zinc-ribbon domain-containing protein [Candidatus Bathyarchaeota archaeon]